MATGAEALSIATTFQPHVIVIDMAMPRLSGPEVVTALRRQGMTAPVIFITGNEFAQPEGCFAVVSKPFDFRRLAEVMRAAMAESQATSA